VEAFNNIVETTPIKLKHFSKFQPNLSPFSKLHIPFLGYACSKQYQHGKSKAK
jgi:hypothetical protein